MLTEIVNFFVIFLSFAAGWFAPSLVAKYIAKSEIPAWTKLQFFRMLLWFSFYYPFYYFVLKGYLSGIWQKS